jgi:peptidoglycan/xylan/chitin deacetylase (PgdA/CDA1 family)
MKYLFYIFGFLYSQVSSTKEIALTFDDVPRPATHFFNGPQRAENLIKNLRAAKIQTVFFVNTVRLDAEGKKRLKQYTDAGILLANHTHSHPNFNDSEVQDYIADFRTADQILAGYPNVLKWFRFPYLREGDTAEKRDQFRKELDSLKYFNAYITVNNYDWYMDELFQKALKNKQDVNMEALKDLYIQIIMESVEYYNEMANKVLGRSPKHILLLHENDLAAMYISDLVSLLRERGWKVISPQEAYADPISEYQYPLPLKYNPGRVGEIAKAAGWPQNKLWYEACDEAYLDEMFVKNGVFEKSPNRKKSKKISRIEN